MFLYANTPCEFSYLEKQMSYICHLFLPINYFFLLFCFPEDSIIFLEMKSVIMQNLLICK